MNEETMAEFYKLVDVFINLANQQSENHNTTRISSVIMFAAARYNTFNFFVTDGERKNEEKAIDYYCEQYRLMLYDNFQETRSLYEAKNEIE